MRGVPGQGVLLRVIRARLKGAAGHGGQSEQQSRGEHEDEQRQQHEEDQRTEHEAQRQRLPARLAQLQPGGRLAPKPAFDMEMLLANPDEQRAQDFAEGAQQGGFHPAGLPDAVKIPVHKMRGIVRAGGLLKRGRLGWIRHRFHGGGGWLRM